MKLCLGIARTGFQLGLGIFWLYSGVTKLWGSFDATRFLAGAIAKAQSEPTVVLPGTGRAISTIALPAVGLVNLAIPWVEMGVGFGFLIAIVNGRLLPPALAVATVLSVLFLACGAGGLNPFLLAAVVFLALVKDAINPTATDGNRTSPTLG